MKSISDSKLKKYGKHLLIAFLPVSAALFLAFSAFTTPLGSGSRIQLVEVAKGSSIRLLADQLEQKGIIRSATVFSWFARIKKVDGKIQAGTYQVNDGMKLAEIIKMMVEGEIYAVKFAVPEGYSIYQLAEMFEAKKIFPKSEFLQACQDKQLLNDLGIPGKSIEGYLFPSTYNFTPGMKPMDGIRMMVDQFEKICGEQLSSSFKKSGQERHELVTIASLIEKEAVEAHERPIISSVFYNRLKKKMRLQSDPTAIYGVRAFGGKVTGKDVRTRTSYNTYTIEGLPPGPIGNPGLGSLQAALKPASTTYLYFVAKRDGTHFFSTSLGQHNKAVKKYLRDIPDSESQSGYRNEHPSITGRR